jgi:hypothetical protein
MLLYIDVDTHVEIWREAFGVFARWLQQLLNLNNNSKTLCLKFYFHTYITSRSYLNGEKQIVLF